MKRLSAVSAGLLVLGLTASGCATHPDSGWTTLIDGPNGLENFNRVGDANWAIKDGVVHADRGGKVPGYLVTKNSYKDFEMRVEFWASHDANSGIFLRCADPTKITDKTCYEANIFDQRPDPSYGTGAIVNVAKVEPMPKAGGQWNTYEITAKGSRLMLTLNGVKTVDVENSQLASGPFALQWGQGVIKFRKVQIRSL
jgi:hypothetical protein